MPQEKFWARIFHSKEGNRSRLGRRAWEVQRKTKK